MDTIPETDKVPETIDEILNLLGYWKENAIECFNSLDLHEPHYKPLYHATWRIALWCDDGNCSVDPLPLIRAEEMLREYVRPTAEIYARPDGKLATRRRRPMLKRVERAFPPAIVTADRIWNVAYARYKASRANGKADLVTISDVAKMVHRGRKSMSEYVREWPTPLIEASGSRSAKWDWRQLYPVVKRQFPSENGLRTPKF